jgi:hypothetical protein
MAPVGRLVGVALREAHFRGVTGLGRPSMTPEAIHFYPCRGISWVAIVAGATRHQ